MIKNDCAFCGEIPANDEVTIINLPDGGSLILCEDCCKRQVESLI